MAVSFQKGEVSTASQQRFRKCAVPRGGLRARIKFVIIALSRIDYQDSLIDYSIWRRSEYQNTRYFDTRFQ